MAHRTVRYEDHITRDPEVLVGKPVVTGTRISVELILGHLAQNLDLDDLFGAYPELTRDDVSAVMAYARDRVRSDGATAAPPILSPADFYREASRRDDVRRILTELAK